MSPSLLITAVKISNLIGFIRCIRRN